MEPRIQYAQTTDGVSIAFWTLGEGTPFVSMPVFVWGHIQMDWQDPVGRSWSQRLAEERQLIRYDHRGCGLSEREVTDFSLDSFVMDLEAVVDHLGLEKFALMGSVVSGPVAISYAARHPERVSHLVLWCSFARTPDIYYSPQVEATLALADKDWDVFTQAMARVLLGWEEGERARDLAEYMRESISPEPYQAFMAARREFDVSDLLPRVRSPTLVLHRRQVPWPPLDLGRRLASRIPDARLALLEGTSARPWVGDMEAVLSAIGEFLGVGEEAEAGAESPEAGAFRTVLFTDVEGSTALTQRLGDARAREVLRQHERIVREALKSHGGSELKTMGDGFMASFSSATRALECAIAMQRAFAVWNRDVGAQGPAPLRVRIGLNAGEPIAEEEDLFGTAVNLAKRICDQAEPGQILVSDVVQQLAAGKGFAFVDKGEATLKGFDEPVRLYEVRWREEE